MATSLNNIIIAIKEVALANGFNSVEELKLNLHSNPDTLLPRLFIRLSKIDYSKFVFDTANEDYSLELLFILADDSANPILDLKTTIDNLIFKFKTNQLLSTLLTQNKIELIDVDLSNDRDIYSKYGGKGATLRLKISNINNFGGIPCQ